jgi:hypothetical protein
MSDSVKIIGRKGKPAEVEESVDGINRLHVTPPIGGIIFVDEVSTTLTYVGYAVPGTAASAASWRIARIQTVGTVLMKTWANGNTNYQNIWNDRASLSYS